MKHFYSFDICFELYTNIETLTLLSTIKKYQLQFDILLLEENTLSNITLFGNKQNIINFMKNEIYKEDKDDFDEIEQNQIQQIN